jgi:hypothetical protein
MDPKQIVTLVQSVTGGMVLALLVWAIIARKLVPGWSYDKKAEECDEWKNRFLAKVDPGASQFKTP